MSHYDCLLDTITDPTIRSLILEVIKDEKTSSNLHINTVFEKFKTQDFKTILEDNYLTLLLLSKPEYWLFYLIDVDFLSYIESDWEEFKKMIKNFDIENQKELSIKKETETQVLSEHERIKKLKILVEIFNKIYPEHFTL